MVSIISKSKNQEKSEVLYNVIETDNLPGLVVEVNKYLSDGWKPVGGIEVVTREHENNRMGYTKIQTSYYQAVVLVNDANTANGFT